MIPSVLNCRPQEELAVSFATLHLFGVTVELSGNDFEEFGWKHGNSFQESRVFITRAFSPKEAREIVRSAVEHWRLEKNLRMTEIKRNVSIIIWIFNFLPNHFLNLLKNPEFLSLIYTDYTTFPKDDRGDALYFKCKFFSFMRTFFSYFLLYR